MGVSDKRRELVLTFDGTQIIKIAETSSKGNQEKWFDAQMIRGTSWTSLAMKFF